MRTPVECPQNRVGTMQKRQSFEPNRYGPGLKKPEGGFVLITGRAILAAWWAYRAGFLKLYDLRVWLACFEAVARRCGISSDRTPRFTFEEIHGLVGGVGGEHVRHAIRRLERVGLLKWATERLDVQVREADLPASVRQELYRTLTFSPAVERRVPMPRRMLRMLAGGATRALLATVFGHLLRCTFYRHGLCFPRGTCKASWIAEAFQVDVRNVKRARQHLIELGWLAQESAGQRTLNRHGPVMTVNLRWGGVLQTPARRRPQHAAVETETSRPAGILPRDTRCSVAFDAHGAIPAIRAARLSTTDLPPRKSFSTSGLPPPYKNRKLFQNIQEPEPAIRGPAGVQGGKDRDGRAGGQPPQPEANCPTLRPRKPPGHPTLRHLVPEDLQDPHRLAVLFDQAVTAGLVTRCEADRLNFFAAAARARAKGATNPCGLFMSLIRRKLWGYITQSDEEAARLCLSRAESEADAQRLSRRTDQSQGELSREAIRSIIAQSLRHIDGFGAAA